MFRKFIIFLAVSSLTILLYFTATTGAIIQTVKPDNIKVLLSTSKLYDSFIDVAIKQASSSSTQKVNNPDISKPNNDSNFNDPAVQEIIRKTFTPKFIQSTTEQVIDGTVPWLEGKSSKPTFSINLKTVKDSLATNTGVYIRDRLATIPACKTGQIPQSTEAINISCKPRGFNTDLEIQKAEAEIKNNQDFLPVTVITADSLTVGEGNNKQPAYQKFHQAPQIYQLIQAMPVILATLAVMSALTIIFVSSDHRRGIKKVASSAIVVGIIIIAEVFVISILVQELQNKISQKDVNNLTFNESLKTFMNLVKTDINTNLTYFGIGFILCGLALSLYLFITCSKKTEQTDNEITENTKAITETSKNIAITEEPEKPTTKPKPKKPTI